MTKKSSTSTSSALPIDPQDLLEKVEVLLAKNKNYLLCSETVEQEILIHDQESLNHTADLLTYVKADAKSFEEESASIVNPAKEIVKKLTGAVKPTAEAFGTLEEVIKARIEQAVIDNEREYLRLLEQGLVEEAEAMHFVRPAHIQFRDKLVAEITDQTALVEWLMANELDEFVTVSVDVKGLTKGLTAAQVEEIPGLKAEDRYTLAVTAVKEKVN